MGFAQPTPPCLTLPPATQSFSQIDSATPSRLARCGSASLVDVRHRKHTCAAAAIQRRHELEPLVEPFAGAPHLEAQQRIQLALAALKGPVGAELVAHEILARQVHAAVAGVLAQVAQNVRQLHRNAEIVGERPCAPTVVASKDR